MDVLVKLTVPNYIYRFYREASAHIADSSPEEVMSDALAAYAGLLSDDISKALKTAHGQDPEKSSVSKSR